MHPEAAPNPLRRLARWWLVVVGIAVGGVPTALLLYWITVAALRLDGLGDVNPWVVALIVAAAVPYVLLTAGTGFLFVQAGRGLASGDPSADRTAMSISGGIAALVVVAGVFGERSPEGQPALANCLLVAVVLLVPVVLILAARGLVRAVALATAVVFVGGAGAAATWRTPEEPTEAERVAQALAARPAPPPVDSPGPTWAASLQGEGTKLAISGDHEVAGVARMEVPIGREHGAGRFGRHFLRFPDGTTWYVTEPFSIVPNRPVRLLRSMVDGSRLTTSADGRSLLKGFDGAVARGTFTDDNGATRQELTLVGDVVLDDVTSDHAPIEPYAATLEAGAGATVSLRSRERGELAVYGRATTVAAGTTHEGPAGAVVGRALTGRVAFRDGVWHVEQAATAAAVQAWVDGWPVARTQVRAVDAEQTLHPGEWARLALANDGAADAQILEIEAIGANGTRVNVGLDPVSSFHTAGVRVGRGGRRINVGGRGVNSFAAIPIPDLMSPGGGLDRELSITGRPEPGEVTLVIRGNFPDVRVRLRFP